jgi:CheY-like chemotaxis protein
MCDFPQPDRPPLVVIDHNPAQRALLSSALTAAGYPVTTAPDGLTGLLAVEELHPALVVVAWDLPFLTGAMVAHALQVGLEQPPPVVALAALLERDGGPQVGDGIAAVLSRWPPAAEVLTVIAALLHLLAGQVSS